MEKKKILIVIWSLVLILIGVIVFCIFQKNVPFYKENVDENRDDITSVSVPQKSAINSKEDKSERWYGDLTEIFEGEWYEQIQGEYWFTAEWF